MARLSHDLDEEVPVCVFIEKNSLTVTPDPVPISIKGNHRVHWFLHGEGTIDSVEFESVSPFKAGHHVPNSKKHVLSDTVSNKAHENKSFKYTVTVTTSGGKTLLLDPQVNIMP